MGLECLCQSSENSTVSFFLIKNIYSLFKYIITFNICVWRKVFPSNLVIGQY